MAQQANKEKSPRIMRFSEVERIVGIPACSIRYLVSRGKFPAPVPLSTKAVGFFSDEIEAWLEGLRGKRIQYSQETHTPKPKPLHNAMPA